MSKSLNKVLSSPDKEVKEAKGVLARLFRQILFEDKMNGQRWNALMVRYLNDPRNNIATNGKDRSTCRNNLNKELSRPTMTWKVFRKALHFLGIVRIRFELHIEWPFKRFSKHSLMLEVNSEEKDVNGEAQDDEA